MKEPRVKSRQGNTGTRSFVLAWKILKVCHPLRDVYLFDLTGSGSDVCQQILDMYIYQHSDENELYTKFKIELNAQAERRGPDPNTDHVTESETSSGIRPSDWEANGTTSLEVINSNQHTVCYDFSCDAA